MDTGGNLYGTTSDGGKFLNTNSCHESGCSGTVFKLTPPSTHGENWTESILWDFGNGTDGSSPAAGLIVDAAGNLYGTTSLGGAYAGVDVIGNPTGGTVFELTPPPTIGGPWTESVLWSFGSGVYSSFGSVGNGTDGSNPEGGLLMDAAGNLYGTTGFGGAYARHFHKFGTTCCAPIGGTVFKLRRPSSSGRKWTESILWSFGSGTDGGGPGGGLLMDAAGNLYGTTSLGGAGSGTVFKLKPPSSGEQTGTEWILWDFGNGTDGSEPEGGLIMDAAGNLYGTTSLGGASARFDNELLGGDRVRNLRPGSCPDGPKRLAGPVEFRQCGSRPDQ